MINFKDVVNNKDFIIKIVFFMALLISVGSLYLSSKLLIDIIYFIIVLILFFKYLWIKLYH